MTAFQTPTSRPAGILFVFFEAPDPDPSSLFVFFQTRSTPCTPPSTPPSTQTALQPTARYKEGGQAGGKEGKIREGARKGGWGGILVYAMSYNTHINATSQPTLTKA
jgi:hypothetical protein